MPTEINYGDYEGASKESARLKLRTAHRYERIPRGESLYDLYLRVRELSLELSHVLSKGHRIVVVGHYWSNRMLIGCLHAVPFDAPGVELTHHGEDCTFETLIKRARLRDLVVASDEARTVRLGDVGRLGDLVDRHSFHPLLGHEAQRRVEQTLTGLPLASRAARLSALFQIAIVLASIAILLRRKAFLYPSAVGLLVRDFLSRPVDSEFDVLTPRELQILKLIAEARTSRQIAADLTISVKTVERHRANILEKLGMSDRVELTRYAIRRGLIEP